jgi:general secretion pathway protein C
MTDKMSSAVSWLGLLLALLFFAWVSSRLTWRVIEPMPELPTQVQAPDRPVAQRQENPAKVILDAHLFGRPEVAAAVKQAPVSRIDLRLFGVLSTGDKTGLAMIGRTQRDLKLYRVEDRLPGAARLLEIHADHVLIESNGRQEVLLLKPDTKLFELRPETAVESPADGLGLSQLRAQLLAQPARMQQLLSIEPVQRDGRLIGYGVSPMPAAEAAFRELGLRPGDVVTSVNGISLDSPDSSLEALQRFSQAGEVSLVVDRGGQRITLRQVFD